jgi:hypothetical protein
MGGAEEQGGRCAALFVMSFLRHEEIYRSDVGLGHAESRSCGLPPALIGLDEFPVGYSLAGCSPADPASALPTGEHSAVNSSRRSMIFHRTANSVLTVCLTSGGRSKEFQAIYVVQSFQESTPARGKSCKGLHRRRFELQVSSQNLSREDCGLLSAGVTRTTSKFPSLRTVRSLF